MFKEWEFEKNLKQGSWRAIDHHISKRKREGKDSEVLHNDMVLPTKKVRKDTLRSREAVGSIHMIAEGGKLQSIPVLFSTWTLTCGTIAPSPDLPKGVIVRTPSATTPNETLLPEDHSSAIDYSMGTFHLPSMANLYDLNMEHTNSFRPDILLSADSEVCSPSHEISGQSPLLGTYSNACINLLIYQSVLRSSPAEFPIFELHGGFRSHDALDSAGSSFCAMTSNNTKNTSSCISLNRIDHIGSGNWSIDHSALHNTPWFLFQEELRAIS